MKTQKRILVEYHKENPEKSELTSVVFLATLEIKIHSIKFLLKIEDKYLMLAKSS